MIISCQPVPSPRSVSAESHASSRSSSKELLFGEISTTNSIGHRCKLLFLIPACQGTNQWRIIFPFSYDALNEERYYPAAIDECLATRSNTSTCNLILSTSSAFLKFWLADRVRSKFLSYIPKDDLPNFRLVCHDFSFRAAPFTFKNITITFKPSTFTKSSRIAALERIGCHVRTLTFHLPHTPETFLPPLVDPCTGEQRDYVYKPQTYTPATLIGRLKQPKYGTWEMTDLLIKQYPPLFHAATNVSSFVRAFAALPSLCHLKICCPGQDKAHRYRRTTVDYALISLRIAIESAPLKELKALTLKEIHAAALLYLQPILGFGASPAALKRWRQVQRLRIEMESFPYGESMPNDHLKILQSYLCIFSPSLERLVFKWIGEKGPCPLSLHSEQYLQPLPAHPAYRNNVSCSPKPSQPKPAQFPQLKYVEVENATTDATQVSDFIMAHRRTLAEFKFEEVQLSKGTWDEALEPLTRITGNEQWKGSAEETMDVPIMISPEELSPIDSSPKDGLQDVEMRHVAVGIVTVGLVKEQRADAGRREMTMSKLWSGVRRGAKGKAFGAGRVGGAAGCDGEGHLKRFLRSSVFTTWR